MEFPLGVEDVHRGVDVSGVDVGTTPNAGMGPDDHTGRFAERGITLVLAVAPGPPRRGSRVGRSYSSVGGASGTPAPAPDGGREMSADRRTSRLTRTRRPAAANATW